MNTRDFFQLVYNTVDTMVAGHFIGEQAIAAIGSTGVIFALIMKTLWQLRAHFTNSQKGSEGLIPKIHKELNPTNNMWAWK